MRCLWPLAYHAFGLRQDADVWSVAAKRVQVLEVPEEVHGDEVQLVVTDETRTLLVDEAASQASIPSLEAFAAEQFGSFVVRASRLDDTLWEVTVMPLWNGTWRAVAVSGAGAAAPRSPRWMPSSRAEIEAGRQAPQCGPFFLVKVPSLGTLTWRTATRDGKDWHGLGYRPTPPIATTSVSSGSGRRTCRWDSGFDVRFHYQRLRF